MKILSRIGVRMWVVLLPLTSFATDDEEDVLKAFEKIKAGMAGVAV
jgi:hypothetical protein